MTSSPRLSEAIRGERGHFFAGKNGEPQKKRRAAANGHDGRGRDERRETPLPMPINCHAARRETNGIIIRKARENGMCEGERASERTSF